jgi:hypothetical protein
LLVAGLEEEHIGLFEAFAIHVEALVFEGP